MEYATTTALNSCENGTALIEPMKETASQIELGSESKKQYFLMEQSEHQEHQSPQQDSKAANTEVICSVEDIEERPLWSNMCRICANINDHLIPIFYGEGVEHALCNKIHKYLPIHVTENDNLPLQLCFHCAATLLAWHELVEGCLEAEQRLMYMQTAPPEKELYREMENKIGMPGKTSQNIERCKVHVTRIAMVNFKNFQKASQMFLHDCVFRMKSVPVAPKSYIRSLERAGSSDNNIRDGNSQVNDESSSKKYLTQKSSTNNSATEFRRM